MKEPASPAGPDGKPKGFNPIRVLKDLQAQEESHRQELAGPRALEPGLARLRSWQSARLQRTYADLLADPRFSPACAFFLSDIYSPVDFSQRDQDAERLYALLRKVVPESMLALWAKTLELNRLTDTLDRDLLDALAPSLEAEEEITAQAYAEAYRACNNLPARRLQIEMLAEILRRVGTGAKHAMVGVTLKAARLPAGRMGWTEMHGFLVRGYAAFKDIGAPLVFAGTIHDREMRILERIYASNPEPFNFD